MNELFIVHYCNPKCLPLQNITRLAKDNAFELANKLSKMNGRSSCRFDNFEKYYMKRIKTEKWLYDTLLSLGLEPKNMSPIYFVLNENDEINNYFGNGRIIKIPLKKIDENDISFTFGDSTECIDNTDKDKLFFMTELNKYINFHDNDINRFLDNIK